MLILYVPQFPADTPKASVSVQLEALSVRVSDTQFQSAVVIGSGLSTTIKHTSQLSAHFGLRPRQNVYEVRLWLAGNKALAATVCSIPFA